jgi:hypothetical protein
MYPFFVNEIGFSALPNCWLIDGDIFCSKFCSWSYGSGKFVAYCTSSSLEDALLAVLLLYPLMIEPLEAY